MIPKRLEAIEAADLEALVASGRAEDRSIEYKEALPGNGAEDKKEFLADVTSLANSGGGDLVYGIREKRNEQGQKTGLPEAVVGLRGLNGDAEKLRLESLLRDSVEPQVRVQMQAIDGFPQGSVLIVRVPQSWAAPHMLKGSPRFYSRNSSGKHPLDLTEIRQAFLLSESIEERIRRFRDDRIARIVAGETPVPLEEGPKAVLHALPVAAFGRRERFSVEALRALQGYRPISGGSSYSARFDGWVTYHVRPAGQSLYYAMSFWNGAQEIVRADIGDEDQGQPRLWDGYELRTVEAARVLLADIRSLGIEPPIFLLLTLVGVRGFTFYAGDLLWRGNPALRLIDRDVLFLPEALVEDDGANVALLLKPAFDAAWNAAGRDRSPNWDDEGRWIARS